MCERRLSDDFLTSGCPEQLHDSTRIIHKSALGNGSHSHRLCKGREWSYICCRTAPYILKTARLRSGRSCSPGISQAAGSAEMVGLAWQSNPFSVTLIKPDGSKLFPDSDRQNIKHVTGTNYDYYFLRNPAKGIWNIEIRPINPGSRGESFSLITGLVSGAAFDQ